jgi:hypothetical protein
MLNEEQLRRLTTQWLSDATQRRNESMRLERSDGSRHATSISMLEAEANALERCAHQVEEIIGSAPSRSGNPRP